MLSDIQVFVRWKDQAIFAGENVECTITFKHVTPGDSGADGKGSQKHYRGGSRPINVIENGAHYSPARSLNPFSFNSNSRRPASLGQRAWNGAEKGHRPSASLSSPLPFSNSFPPSAATGASNGRPSGHGHRRSVSIISLEQPDLNPERKSIPSPFSPRLAKGHARSASFQVPTRRNDVFGNGTQSGNYSHSSPSAGLSSKSKLAAPRSPLPQVSSVNSPSSLSLPSVGGEGGPSRVPSRSPTSNPSRRPHRSRQKRGDSFPMDFKFPQAPPSRDETENSGSAMSSSSRINEDGPSSDLFPSSPVPNVRPKRSPEPPGHLTPAIKILSNSIVDGSTRSSGEFYSLSNNSTETLESEYVIPPMSQPRLPLRHRRHYSNLDSLPGSQISQSQRLLMGYAQVSASFTVDGSLVNQSIFEEVKRNAVMGTQGHRDASSKMEKPRQGFWGNLGLAGVSDSISGLLSGGELNGLREMRGVSSSQSIPLLSTPQSLLFVDLGLGPGEEKSFSFSFTLPKGLPATYKGKAMNFSYNLIIGTQRTANAKDVQRVHRINIPFRVLSGVDGQGSVLGHDLMRPYVLLRDEARVRKVEVSSPLPAKPKSISTKQWTSASEFLSYVDEILGTQPRRGSFNSITSPPEALPSQESADRAFSCKDTIDMAILRSNQSCASGQSTNRFEISRNGRRIAVVVLNRPAHRLGETVVATIDFSNAALPCYCLRGSLETYEKVNPTIALRSSTSITRATRKVHATCFDNTLFSTKVAFMPSIPVSATPTLITSGVNLEWQLRFEFVTCGLHHEEDAGVSGINLLEIVERDDRGAVFAALENVLCQSFEVSIPLTVYGDTIHEPESEELQGYPI
ncbi:intracellular protein transporter [Coccidioides immitis RS]|uniref:Intracellular protein transporter n=3 Tax=Coccidioides TaxID=5500 RepID=A0A0D8JW32_COCIM|nr:intracellular protein transporter [Coccidioides immitis RS]KJF61121.1 intracellular protein transporter [Coccidioides immitis RS]